LKKEKRRAKNDKGGSHPEGKRKSGAGKKRPTIVKPEKVPGRAGKGFGQGGKTCHKGFCGKFCGGKKRSGPSRGRPRVIKGSRKKEAEKEVWGNRADKS